MRKTVIGVLFTAFLSLLVLGCAASAPAPRVAVPAVATTVWRGTVELAESRTFPRGSRLVIEPGTTVRFAAVDEDGDGWGDVSLRVEGDLIARGTPERPIRFTSQASPAEPGSWGEIRIDFGAFEFSYVVLEGSTRGLHAHFSRGTVRDCVLRWNVDGTRLGESEVDLEHNLFYGHQGKAYNARNCRNTVRGNRFHHNRNGIFLFEADQGSVIEGNHLRHHPQPLRLGDFFNGTVHTQGNDWGDPLPAPGELAPGQVLAAAPAPVTAAGPRAWPHWEEQWLTRFEGYVDSAPVWTDEGLYVANWSGELARLGFLDGVRRATVTLPDVVDAGLAVAGRFIAAQAWDRGVYLLDRQELTVLASFREHPSPADDHRQAAPLIERDTVYAATWAGSVHALVREDAALVPRWSFRANGPFRGDLTGAGGLLLAPGADGILYALDPADGSLRWSFPAGRPLLSAAAADQRRAYLADRGGTLWAVGLEDGALAWRVTLGGPVWYAPPLLRAGVLYQGDDSGALTAVRATDGAVQWTRNLGAGVRARPAPLDGELLAVPTLDGRLYLLDAADGAERDCWQADEASGASPATRGSTAVFAARDGTVRALRTVAGSP
ncbi:MAG: PQQ-binding-like beta-propeller repeat protein [Deferrisomatales bacterium]|nr:PQQ-binding-like beta-propeller repeat protein [Deferrisomatales bacterium]